MSQQKGSAGYKVGPEPIVINGGTWWCPYKWPEINGLSEVSSPRNQWSYGPLLTNWIRGPACRVVSCLPSMGIPSSTRLDDQ